MSTTDQLLTAALVVKLTAKPDKADEVGGFLADAVALANQENGTVVWFALRTDTTTFWIVDAFPSNGERQAHLDGAIGSSLVANAERLFDVPPEILPAHVLAAKVPQRALAFSARPVAGSFVGERITCLVAAWAARRLRG